MTEYKLPNLPYEYDALEPHISKTIMEIHHSKHHQIYVNNLNNAINKLKSLDSKDIQQQIQLQSIIKFNGGGHINHSIFWENLAPAKSDSVSKGLNLKNSLVEQYGSFDEFEKQFITLLLSIQGSGWGWLVLDKSSENFELISTLNQDPIDVNVYTVLIGIDFWEHAYYLQYYNDKLGYIKQIFHVLNWDVAEKRWAHNYKLNL